MRFGILDNQESVFRLLLEIVKYQLFRVLRLQESLLSLGAAMTASEFRNAVCEGLHATLSHVVRE